MSRFRPPLPGTVQGPFLPTLAKSPPRHRLLGHLPWQNLPHSSPASKHVCAGFPARFVSRDARGTARLPPNKLSGALWYQLPDGTGASVGR